MSVDKKKMETIKMTEEEALEAQKFITGIAFIATSAGFNFGYGEEYGETVLGNERMASVGFADLLINSYNILKDEKDATPIMFSCFLDIIGKMIDENGVNFGESVHQYLGNYLEVKKAETGKFYN